MAGKNISSYTYKIRSYTYIYMHIHTYTFIYLLMYFVCIWWFILYVLCLYFVCICTYTRICTYFLHGKLLVGSIRAYTCIYWYTYKINRVYWSYTSAIHTNTYNIHTFFFRTRFFRVRILVYVYACICSILTYFCLIRTVTKKYVRSRYMHVYVRIHMYMHVCHILATCTG